MRAKTFVVTSAFVFFSVAVVASASHAPTNLSILKNSARTVTVGWAAVPGVTGYGLFVDGVRVSTAGAAATSAKFGTPQWRRYVLGVSALKTGGATSSITVDPKWVAVSVSIPPEPQPIAACADGLDNDGDGKVDLADPGCSSATDTDETDAVIPPTGCAVTTPHVPDGPDGMGGCWPGPSNTGPNAPQSSMTLYTGPCNITTANTVIASKIINCDIGVNAPGFRIENSYFYGSIGGNGQAYVVQDTYMKGTQGSMGAGFDCTDCGFDGPNFTILRTEIEGTNRAAWCEEVCVIEDSYLHTAKNLDPNSGAHASAVRQEHYATIRHNTLLCSYTGPNTSVTGCSADITGYPDFTPVHHNTIERNLLMANNITNGFCAYGGGTAGKPYSGDPLNATYIVFRDNVFQGGPNGKCGAFGPITDYKVGRTGNVWSNNKFDNGTVINPDGSEAGPSPSPTCTLQATPSNFAAQVSAATAGQTVCLASGNYGSWGGTNKAITVANAPGASPQMNVSFGSGDTGFTLSGMTGMGAGISNGATNITIRNSTFTGIVNISGSGTDGIVLDNNTHNWNVGPSSGGPNAKIYLENSLTGTLGSPSVTISNSEIRNGDLDGIHFGGGSGYQILNNVLDNLCDRGANHTDNMQFDTSSTSQVRIAGNYVHANDGCGTQGITSYDHGTNGVIIENNVVDIHRPWGIELYSDVNSIVRHNTVVFYPDSQCDFSGITCGKIDINRKSADPAGTGTQAYNNLATVEFNAGSTGTSDHNVSGNGAVFVGPLTTHDGFLLAPSSPVGRGAARDGSNVGVYATG